MADAHRHFGEENRNFGFGRCLDGAIARVRASVWTNKFETKPQNDASIQSCDEGLADSGGDPWLGH